MSYTPAPGDPVRRTDTQVCGGFLQWLMITKNLGLYGFDPSGRNLVCTSENAADLIAGFLKEVEPVDPDAALVEVMAEALYDIDDLGGWELSDTDTREYYLSNARAALAAARTFGAL